MLGDFRGKSWGRSQPFSPDAEIISVPLQTFINSSRCHTLGWKCQERKKKLKKSIPVGKGSQRKQPYSKTWAQQPHRPLGWPLLDRNPMWWVAFSFLPGNIMRN